MSARLTLDDVMPAAHEMLELAARRAPAGEMAGPAERLTDGTREGKAQANLLLAQAFAEILDAERPAEWRTSEGVPDVPALVEACDDRRYVSAKADEGEELDPADAKARLAAHGRAVDLAMLYLRYWHLRPEQLEGFVADARRMTPLMVDHVWGALWIACTAVRAL
ncbi:hypothetical protein ACWD4F_41505 [Streptomyces aureus]